jgi:DNA-binding response OmpR family regulator
MRVLVVEDEKKTASFVRKALESEGIAVDVCHRGEIHFESEPDKLTTVSVRLPLA